MSSLYLFRVWLESMNWRREGIDAVPGLQTAFRNGSDSTIMKNFTPGASGSLTSVIPATQEADIN
jgi:hypothetical protein